MALILPATQLLDTGHDRLTILGAGGVGVDMAVMAANAALVPGRPHRVRQGTRQPL